MPPPLAAARATAPPTSLGGLLPFLMPYRVRIGVALFFLLATAAATLAFPLALRSLIDGGIAAAGSGGQVAAVQGHFANLFLLSTALGVLSAGRFYMVSWLGERVTADLRNAVYSHVLDQSPEFFETTQTGEVLSRLSADTTLVQTVVGSSLSMGLRNLVMGIGALGMLIYANPLVMLQVLAVLLAIIAPSVWFGRRVRRLSRASQDRVADASAIAAEVLNAIPVVQSYNAQGRESTRFADSTTRAFETAIRRSMARAVLVAFIIVATSAALLWGLYQGTQAVAAGTITAGDLGQTVVYVIILASAFAVLGEVYGDLLRAAGATERLVELLHSRSSIESPAVPLPAALPAAGSAVRMDNIGFHYPSRPLQNALTDFTLDVQPGQTVAIVGPSGAGKTTVFQLLLRMYDPQTGGLLIDGVPCREMALEDLRHRVGIVPQDPVIFSTSALENIRYGKPQASDAEVHDAAQAAFADAFIRELPQGYDTFLGERGIRLSGGQRQRIAIARAILKNPPLLLLDEATSALDAESERMVQAALEAAMRNRTTLVIAHRLATVQKADRIVVIDRGRLVEQGTHAELVAQGGVYAGLAALQFNA
jgi:ATP-binding cassette subfamily B protein